MQSSRYLAIGFFASLQWTQILSRVRDGVALPQECESVTADNDERFFGASCPSAVEAHPSYGCIMLSQSILEELHDVLETRAHLPRDHPDPW